MSAKQIEYDTNITTVLYELTGYKHIKLSNRCRSVMRRCMEVAVKLGKKRCLLLEKGSYHAYRNIAKKLDIPVSTIKSPDALIDLDDLKKHCDQDTFLMIHSSALYSVIQPMAEVERICRERGCLLINDCTGSITDKNLLKGDFLICSFAYELPVNFGTGGFIATNHEELLKFMPKKHFELEDIPKLKKCLIGVGDRVAKLNQKMLVVLDELSAAGYECINNNRTVNLYLHVHFKDHDELMAIAAILVKHQLYYHVNHDRMWVIVMSVNSEEINRVLASSDGDMAIENFKIIYKPN